MKPTNACLRLALSLLFIWPGLVFLPTAQANDQTMYNRDHPVWHGHSLARLSKYIGTDNNRAVLDDPEVIDAMKGQLGGSYKAVRERLLGNPAIIGFNLLFLDLRGSLTAQNNQEQAAILIINLTNSIIYTGLLTGGKTIVYGNHGPDEDKPLYGELPEQLRLWVAQTANQDYADEPPTKNFEWHFKSR